MEPLEVSEPDACVIYARTSTADQRPSNQVAALRRMAEQRNLKVHEVYVEQASGRKKRPVLEELFQEAHRGPPWSAVLVFALDRLGRRMMDVLHLVTRLDELGIAVISHQEPWTSNTGPTRALMLSVMAWVLEVEIERIRQRTRLGLEQARRRGARIGRPPLDVDVEKLANLRASGMSFRQIGREIGIGASSAHRLLKAHQTLCGDRSKTGRARGAENHRDSNSEIRLCRCSEYQRFRHEEEED